MMKLLVCVLAASVAFGCSADYLIWIPRSSSADPLGSSSTTRRDMSMRMDTLSFRPS